MVQHILDNFILIPFPVHSFLIKLNFLVDSTLVPQQVIRVTRLGFGLVQSLQFPDYAGNVRHVSVRPAPGHNFYSD